MVAVLAFCASFIALSMLTPHLLGSTLVWFVVLTACVGLGFCAKMLVKRVNSKRDPKSEQELRLEKSELQSAQIEAARKAGAFDRWEKEDRN